MIALLGYGLFLLMPVFYFRVDENDLSYGNHTGGSAVNRSRVYDDGIDYSKLFGIDSPEQLFDRGGPGPVGVALYMSLIALVGMTGAYVNRFTFELLVIAGPRATIL